MRAEKESWTPEEVRAHKTVEGGLKYLGDRYQVPIPWRRERPNLPDNKQGALRRLASLEVSLRKKGKKVVDQYSQAFQDNVEKGYIRELTESEAKTVGWYLPHFPVIREDKETTKVRIVYDAAAVFENASLNEGMLPGPNLQRDILEILLKFRSQPVVLVGDIKEMFNQVVMAPEDRRFHRLLWRGLDPTAAVKTYETERLMFGDKASPFLAMYVLRRHAETVASEFPVASEILQSDVYMDDVITSLEDIETAKVTRTEIQKVAAPAGFFVRRWCSNKEEVLEGVPEDERASGVIIRVESRSRPV